MAEPDQQPDFEFRPFDGDAAEMPFEPQRHQGQPTMSGWALAQRLLLTMSLLLCFLPNELGAQVTSNVFRRIVKLKIGDFTGTGFTIEDAGRQYLITAKHVVSSLEAKDTVQVEGGGSWKPLAVQVMRCDDPIDIAVLIPSRQVSVTFPLEPTMKDIQFGQDVYFLGFPYGLGTTGVGVNDMFPVAFIKKGVMSASVTVDGAMRVYLDGHNNPGFSGGPIVFRPPGGNKPFRVMAVVSGYRPEYVPVLNPELIDPKDITPEDRAKSRIIKRNGLTYRLNETSRVVRQNTGIVVGYNIQHALDMIRTNPVGPEI